MPRRKQPQPQDPCACGHPYEEHGSAGCVGRIPDGQGGPLLECGCKGFRLSRRISPEDLATLRAAYENLRRGHEEARRLFDHRGGD